MFCKASKTWETGSFCYRDIERDILRFVFSVPYGAMEISPKAKILAGKCVSPDRDPGGTAALMEQTALAYSDHKELCLAFPKLQLEWKKTAAEEKAFRTMVGKIDCYWKKYLAAVW